MSIWTHINGVITVHPMGRTAHEKQYIIETVLDHLPRVAGTEGELKTWVLPKHGVNCFSSHNEFGELTNREETLRHQSYYVITVEADLRDRTVEYAKRDFLKWLCRLSKRLTVSDILVRLTDGNGNLLIDERNGAFHDMFELPSWVKRSNESNWCEYLMWDSEYQTMYPAVLAYRYYADPEIDEEIERRREFQNGSGH